MAVPQALIGLFTGNPETIRLGREALRLISIGFIVSSVSVTVSGALEGLGKGKESLVISLLRYIVVILPLAFILSRLFQAAGVWHAFWIDRADTEIYQKDIEQEFKVSRATASNMLQLMERKGLIVRESVSRDARLKKISLTEKAKNMVAKSDADIREMEQLITKGFHKDETEQLKHYLDRIMENIGVTEDCCGRKCKSGAKEQKNHNI